MELLRALAGVLWGVPMMALLLAAGVFFTVYLGAFQFRRPGRILRATVLHALRSGGAGGVCTALAATIGVGSIAGVATALALGGPGAVFWLWVAAALSMATGFAENVLGVRFRRMTPDGPAGGPMYYIPRVPGLPHGGTVYAICCLLAALGIGCLLQAGAIVEGLGSAFAAPETAVGIVLTLLTAVVTLGGAARIGRVAELLVPAMLAVYLSAALCCLVLRAERLPGVLLEIFRSAFTPRAAAGGAPGFLLALRWGVARGVFSCEAGLGSTVLAHAAAAGATPVRQGYWSVFETAISTLLLCTATALVILTSGVPLEAGAGTALAAAAFSAALGPTGGAIVAVSLTLFAFSTILGWNHYGACCAGYLAGPRGVPVFRLAACLCVLAGSVVQAENAWLLVDICCGLMAAPNLCAMVALRKEVKLALQKGE